MFRNYYLVFLFSIVASCNTSQKTIIYSDSDKFGVKKLNGEILTTQLYDEIVPIDSGNFYKVRKGYKKWGLIAKNGQEITEVKFSRINDFYLGYSSVSTAV